MTTLEEDMREVLRLGELLLALWEVRHSQPPDELEHCLGAHDAALSALAIRVMEEDVADVVRPTLATLLDLQDRTVAKVRRYLDETRGDT